MSGAASQTPPCYRVDGRCVATTVELALPPASEAQPDWTIAIEREPVPFEDGAVTWTGDVSQESGRWGRFGRWAGRACVRLEGLFDLVADVERGRATLHHARGAAADAALVRHALPYLAALERRLVLHAASVVLPEGAVLICAEAQTGKSTLALALDACGHPVLGDDHVALEFDGRGVRAHASLPTIDTRPASRAVFFRAQAQRPGKASSPCRTPRPAGPVPVARIAFLARGEPTSPRRIAPTDVVRRLLLDVLFVGDPGDAREQATRLEDAVRLARVVPAYELTLPEGLEALARQLPSVIRALRAPEQSTRTRSSARLDLAALLWVAALRAAVSLLPLPRVRRLVARIARTPPRGRPTRSPDPHAVGLAVRRATRAIPRATCLVQSLAAQGLLEGYGYQAVLHLGATKRPDGTLEAHAWVECGGDVIVGEGPGAHTPLGGMRIEG